MTPGLPLVNREFVLGEEERERLVEMMRCSKYFCGVRDADPLRGGQLALYRDGFLRHGHGMTIAISLPPELQEFVEESVRSGQFGSEAEVLIGALASLKTKEEFRQFQLAKLRGKLQSGFDQLDRGETVEWNVDDFKRRAREHLGAQQR
jgi:putative addiction module CopG family antidote